MILLDTSVISELWRPQPNPHVVGWIDAQAVETLFLSVVTVAELRFGIAVMPEGRKRSTLHSRLEQVRTNGKSPRATSSRPQST